MEQVPIDDYEIPLGKAEILTPGSDLTVLTWGTPVYHCETALHLLANPPASLAPHVPASLRGAKIELIDLRTILPWDVATVEESVRRTGRLVIVHEASRTGGVGGEIAAEIQKRCFLKLHAPVKRVTAWEYVVSLLFCVYTYELTPCLQHACSYSTREVCYTRPSAHLGWDNGDAHLLNVRCPEIVITAWQRMTEDQSPYIECFVA